MFSGQNNLSEYSKINLTIWFTLAFQAGAINAGGFLACHRFVTHTTGFATHFGAEFADGHWLSAFGMLSVPLFFLLGSMISAFFVDRRIAINKEPNYVFLFLIMFFILVFVSLSGIHGRFGEFGEPMTLVQDYALLALLSLVSGIQNASISSASGSIIRTTHLTGLTTDLGIGLVRLFTRNLQLNIKEKELRQALMRMGIIFFFILGSTLSAFVFIKNKYVGFYIPAFTTLMILIFGIYRKNFTFLNSSK